MIYHHVYKFWLLSLLEKYGNFKEAASYARITQSALSQNLTSLESVLKKSLVVRERGSVSLTEDGRQIMEKLRPILESLDFIDLDNQQDSVLKGSIRLGAYESIAVNCLPKLFKVIGNAHPELRLDVQTSRTDTLVKAVRKGSLDLALVVNADQDSKLNVEPIAQDELGLFVSKDIVRENSQFDDFSNMGLATISSGPDGYPLYYKRFVRRIPKPVKTVITCDSFETIRNFAAQGLMIGLLPLKVAQRTPGLVKIWPMDLEDGKVSTHSISLVSRKNVDAQVTELIKQEFTRVCDETQVAPH